jgi:transposase
MRHPLVKSGAETIAKALTGEYRPEHLFALKQALQTYDFYQQQIKECDRETRQYLSTLESKADPEELKLKPMKKNKHRRRKNEPYFDLRAEMYRITGVDLTLINGIDAMTAYTIISEIGIELSAFPSEKQFASWCALCPNNRITGGKVHSTRTRKVRNRVAHALRLAAQSLHSSSTALGAYYRRMRARLGPSKAITATAHKLAVLVYRMLKHGEDYVDKGVQYYEERYKERALKNLRRRANVLGYSLVPIRETQPISQNICIEKPPLTGLVS